MPFHDRDWEDFQRDCTTFPAYTDYIFGVDTRPEAAEQLGLHPQIYVAPPPPPPPLSPPQRLYTLPQPARYPAAYDSVRDAPQTRAVNKRTPKATFIKRESSLSSMAPSPCPPPRALPAPAQSLISLLRPGELRNDPSYAFIPQTERLTIDKNLTQAWTIVRSDAISMQKMEASEYITGISRAAAIKRNEHRIQETEGREAERQKTVKIEHQNMALHEERTVARLGFSDSPGRYVDRQGRQPDDVPLYAWSQHTRRRY